MKDKGKLKSFLSGHNIVIVPGMILVFVALYIFIPKLLMPKPIIHTLIPDTVMENSDFNNDRSIIIEGEKLNNLVAIYVNGVWEPECDIITQTDNSIQIVLPPEYYLEEK